MMENHEFHNLSDSSSPSLIREFWQFLAHTKKWWLLPILGIVLLLGALIFLSSTPLAPLIYTLF